MKILHSHAAGLLSASSILARRVAFPLLFLGAGLVLVQPCARASGVFEDTGSLNTARRNHTATLLPNGKVLVTGGDNNTGALAGAELYDSANGTWTVTGSLNTARDEHTATLLPNGKVLVAGGVDFSGPSPSAELYDPASGTWTATGSLNIARSEHTASLLPNGKVLVAGGFNNTGALAGAELYDPASGTWAVTGSLNTARRYHTATLLPNGKVLVAGGEDISGNPSASAELYDPASGSWTTTGSLNDIRALHTASLLPNGKVLVAGGYYGTLIFIGSAELYDPASGTWAATGSLNTTRAVHTATLLPNGKVLVSAGFNHFNGWLASAELYGPAPTTLGNISTRAFVQTGDNVMIGGFIITGSGQKRVIVRAIGPSLVNYGITNPLQDPTLELHDHTGAVIAFNDNWMDAPNRQEIIDSGLAPSNNLESAILMSLTPGSYTAIVRGVNNGTGIGLVEGYDLDLTAGSKLGNISTRALVQTGDNIMIGGFIITGAGEKTVIVRAIGPSLAQYGITNPLLDPTLELHDGNGAVIAFNDNWMDAPNRQEIIDSGLAPSNNLESAILVSLTPGSYTAIVRGVNNTIGVALVEVYGLN